MSERAVSIPQFRGLNDYGLPENDPTTTRSLEGVITKYGRIFGVPGAEKFDGISTASSASIISLMPFYTANLATTLYRMLPTKVEQHNVATHTWADVTGTALNGFDYTLPQWVVHQDTLCFVNEGADRPRKLTGSGNSATLGGTPPHAKVIFSAWGFLFLGNVSLDGGVTFDPRGVLYSDDFDNNWDLCGGNTLAFNQTQGEIVVASPIGTRVVVGKSDSLFWIEFIGGLVRFAQDKIVATNGVLSPRSFKVIDDLGVIVFLATDMRLKFCNGIKIDTVPPNVQRKLDETLDPQEARWSIGEVYPDKDFYSLFYLSKDGNTNQILLNFRSGEFSHREYPTSDFTAAVVSRRNGLNRFFFANSSLVYEEADTIKGFDGARIDRFYDIDWSSLGLDGEKWLKGVEFSVIKKPGGRISIAVASDQRNTFQFEKFYTLKNMSAEGDYVKIIYRIDPGLRGREHKVRISLFHDENGRAVEIVPPARIIYEPLSELGTSVETNAAPTPSNRTA